MSKRNDRPSAPWGKAFLIVMGPLALGLGEHNWHQAQQRHLDDAVGVALDSAARAEDPTSVFEQSLLASLGQDARVVSNDVVASFQQDRLEVAVAMPYGGLNPFRDTLQISASQPLRR